MAKKTAFEVLQELKKQPASPAPTSPSVAPSKGKPSAFDALQELKKKKAEPAPVKKVEAKPVVEAPKPTTTLGKTSVGPRVSLLQQVTEQAMKPTIRAATPEEQKRIADPVSRAKSNAIGNSTPEAKQLRTINDAPTELHGLVSKTLPNISKTGTNWVNNAEKISKQTGLSKAGIEAAGNTLAHSADILSDFTGKVGKVLKTPNPGTVLDTAVAAFNVGAIPFIAATEGLKTIPVVGKPAGKAVEKTFETLQKAGSYGFESTLKG